jgi:hypothetical protein
MAQYTAAAAAAAVAAAAAAAVANGSGSTLLHRRYKQWQWFHFDDCMTSARIIKQAQKQPSLWHKQQGM